MKARVIQTGEIINVVPKVNSNAQSSLDNLYESNNRAYRNYELDFVNVYNIIDWEQRKYEIAKAAMQGLLNATSIEKITLRIKPSTIAEVAIEYSDALITELKKK